GRKKLQGGGRLAPTQQVTNVQIHDQQKGGKQQGQSRMLVQAQSFQGPLPSPDILRGFGEVIPGLDKKIVAWVEEETAHRREMERREMTLYERAVRTDGRLQGVGMFLHFVLIAGLFGLAWLALTTGQQFAGTA